MTTEDQLLESIELLGIEIDKNPELAKALRVDEDLELVKELVMEAQYDN